MRAFFSTKDDWRKTSREGGEGREARGGGGGGYRGDEAMMMTCVEREGEWTGYQPS